MGWSWMYRRWRKKETRLWTARVSLVISTWSWRTTTTRRETMKRWSRSSLFLSKASQMWKQRKCLMRRIPMLRTFARPPVLWTDNPYKSNFYPAFKKGLPQEVRRASFSRHEKATVTTELTSPRWTICHRWTTRLSTIVLAMPKILCCKLPKTWPKETE